MYNSVSILIPVYNEAKTLELLIERVEAASFCGLKKHIILINDGSSDRSNAILDSLKSRSHYTLLSHAANKGKGAAIRTGLNAVQGDLAVIQDADLEYDPNDYDVILQTLIEQDLPVVYGSRFLRNDNTGFSGSHRWGNQRLTELTNWLFGSQLTDMETCYKAFRSDLITSLPLESNDFRIEPEITAKILRQGVNITEVPIRYQGRTHADGKKIGWTDGMLAVGALIKYRYK